MGDKLTGKVKWYNSQRGFGLITGSDGKEYFVHSSQLSPNLGEIKIGTRLIFETTPRPHYKGGFEAVQVEIDVSPIPEPPKAKLIRPTPQLSQSATADSGIDYWYQSYATATDNQSANRKPIETKVVGVTYEGRQSIVALLSVGEEVQLVREPDNPYDKNAIKVVRKTGQCFGFISKVLASGFAPKFDDYGKPVEAVIISVTKGYSSDSNIGVTIQFNLPEMPDSESDFE